MDTQFTRVLFVTLCCIFFENNAQLTSRGNTMRKTATSKSHEFLKIQKVENRSSCSPIFQNSSETKFISVGSLLEKDTNEIYDKDYSGKVGMESTIASVVSMERELTITPLTIRKQYISGEKETYADAYSKDGATLKASEKGEITGDLYSTIITEFEFSGSKQLDTIADMEGSGDLSQDSTLEGSGEDDYYFVTNFKSLGTNTELDLDSGSMKQEYPSKILNAEGTKVSSSTFSSSDELPDLQNNKILSECKGVCVFNVENNTYISSVPQDADNFKTNSFLAAIIRNLDKVKQSTVSSVWNDDANGKFTAELLSISSAARRSRYYGRKLPTTPPTNRMSSTSAVNRKRYKTSQVAATIPRHRLSSVSAAKLEKYRASRVPSAFSRELDSEEILSSLNEVNVVLNELIIADNSLQDLYLENIANTSQRILWKSKTPEGRAATSFKRSSTSYSSEYRKRDKQRSRTVFISTSPLKVQTSTKDYVLQNGMKTLFNSTVNDEPSATLAYPYRKVLIGLIGLAIVILFLVVAIITVIFIRVSPHKKNCCTRTGSRVEEPRSENSSVPLNEVVVHGGTNPRNVEHLGVNEEEEEYKFWVAPLNE